MCTAQQKETLAATAKANLEAAKANVAQLQEWETHCGPGGCPTSETYQDTQEDNATLVGEIGEALGLLGFSVEQGE